MEGSIVGAFDVDDSGVQASTFRFRHPKPKKYMLHKMVTFKEKEQLAKLKKRIKKKDPEYFSMMLKQQRKKMFVNTFVKKLKNSITLTQPPAECKSSSQEMDSEELESFEVPKNIQLAMSIFLFVHIIPLLVLNSLSLIFDDIYKSDLLMGYNVFGFIVHILEMVIKLLIKHNYQEKKKKYLIQNINSYLYSQDLIIDLIVFIGFVGSFGAQSFSYIGWNFICHLMIIMKIKTLLMTLGHIELVFIQNQYRQLVWNLIKVFLFNFVIAHCLTIILISMASFNSDKNWMTIKGLSQSRWNQQYVWAYYWATTIMLTVGFGDIVPTNQDQALCMIFVETMSCIVLAFNINRVGQIISKIRSYDLEKNSNLKVFNQISQKTCIDPEIQDKLTNYIKESTIIKRNSNIQQEKKFISKLPRSFKEELLKEMNKNVWNGMIFFRNLSEKSLLELSKYLEKKLTHPEEIVYTRGQEVDLMIFNNGTFGLAYNNGSIKTNGQIIQTYHVKSNQFRIASLEFLLDRPMNYDIKCIDYTIFYKVTLKAFLSILENHPYDYEYYFMIKQKDKFLLNEFQIEKCHICQNQRHTMIKCPRLHYIPLKQHVIGRYTKGLIKKHLQNLRSKILKRQKISDIATLKQRKNIKHEMVKIRYEIFANKSQSEGTITSRDDNTNSLTDLAKPESKDGIMTLDSATIQENFNTLDHKTYFTMAVDHIKENLFPNREYVVQEKASEGVWELECDLAHNYKFFFKNFNSEDLGKKVIKRKPKLSVG